jgi:hypothetical protein
VMVSGAVVLVNKPISRLVPLSASAPLSNKLATKVSPSLGSSPAMLFSYWVARAMVKVSIVVKLPTVVAVLVSCNTPEVVPTSKSMRGKLVDELPASAALPTKRAQPAVPMAEPKSFHVSEDFDSTPRTAGEVKVKPLLAEPATHAAPSLVIFPIREPDGASSALAGLAPLYTKIHPVVKMLFKLPVVSNMVFAPVLILIFAILIVIPLRKIASSRRGKVCLGFNIPCWPL